MAVPDSGPITMLAVAQERKYGTYGSGTISFPITMFDLLNGGGSNGFPALNECPYANTPSYSMSGWYGYNQTASCGGGCVPTYLGFGFESPEEACFFSEQLEFYTTSTMPEAPWRDNSPIFSDNRCSGPVLDGWYSDGREVAYYSRGRWNEVLPCG